MWECGWCRVDRGYITPVTVPPNPTPEQDNKYGRELTEYSSTNKGSVTVQIRDESIWEIYGSIPVDGAG